MALNADVQVLTQPGATGNQTYSLPANFDPKAVILWAVPAAADGTVAHYSLGMGFGTYRGSVVQQRCVAMRGLDAAASADTGRSGDVGALLRLMTSAAGSFATDMEITLTSMQTGATSEVTLNWTNLHTTASIRVFMLVLGGDEITDALVDDFTMGTGSTTQDETVVAGFGKPDLLFFLNNGASSTSATSPQFCFGFAKQGEAGRSIAFSQVDGNTASLVAMRQRSDRAFMSILATGASAGTDEALGRLDTVAANWPTDGFRTLFDANPTLAHPIRYLAIRTTGQIATGAGTSPISGTPPVVQSLDAGFPPKVSLIFGWNQGADTTLNTTGADLAGFGIGAYDGATEAWAGITEDDAAATMVAKSHQSTAKVHRIYTPAGVLDAEADGAFSGNNFDLSWNDISTTNADQYQYLILGDKAPPRRPDQQLSVYDHHMQTAGRR